MSEIRINAWCGTQSLLNFNYLYCIWWPECVFYMYMARSPCPTYWSGQAGHHCYQICSIFNVRFCVFANNATCFEIFKYASRKTFVLYGVSWPTGKGGPFSFRIFPPPETFNPPPPPIEAFCVIWIDCSWIVCYLDRLQLNSSLFG
jgi:hypothetical protein